MSMNEQEYEAMTKLVKGCNNLVDRIATLEEKVKALEEIVSKNVSLEDFGEM